MSMPRLAFLCASARRRAQGSAPGIDLKLPRGRASPDARVGLRAWDRACSLDGATLCCAICAVEGRSQARKNKEQRTGCRGAYWGGSWIVAARNLRM